jgi:Hint module
VVGDRVLAADAAGRISFSEVVFVPHKANRDTALFVHITTASGRDIKMTKSHVLPAGACGTSSPLPLKYASQVTVNDCVTTVSGEESVSSVGTTMAEGLQTLVTKEEFVIVNGIISSPFAYNHIAGNMYYHIHRFLYEASPQLLLSPFLRAFNEVRNRGPRTIWVALRFDRFASAASLFLLYKYLTHPSCSVSPYLAYSKLIDYTYSTFICRR